MISAKFKVSAQFDFDELMRDISFTILNAKTESTLETIGDNKLIIAEKFFMRTSNVASATMLFTKQADGYDVLLIISGAGGGMLNSTLGAAKKYLEEVSKFLIKQGALEINERRT